MYRGFNLDYPPRVPCACCFKETIRALEQKKTYYFNCSGCPVKPLVCANCRKNSGKLPHTTICGWCNKSGSCESIQSAHQAFNINHAANCWVSVRTRYSNIEIPYIKQISLNWIEYHKFNRIRFLRCEEAKSFFVSLMQAQMFKTLGAQKISIQYDKIVISPKLFLLVKNITVARMLTCNLFFESKNTRFFAAGRRNIVRRNDELMSMVLHRLLSNFALLTQ
jgi:hypothetical protein